MPDKSDLFEIMRTTRAMRRLKPDPVPDAFIYPAVQNMLLAARALGLGATLTTRHLLYEKESEAALGLPPGVHSYAILPIGYPMGRFGPVGRGPLKDIVYENEWGRPYLAGEEGG